MVYFDHIVIGAGVEGSSTAYSLAKNGYKTLLIEQFRLGHAYGSSHGGSRLFRKSYDKSLYTAMTMDSEQDWRDLEKECGKELLKKTGMLLMAPGNTGIIGRYKTVTDSYGLACTTLDKNQLKEKYPQLHSADTWEILYEPDGGACLADKCLEAYHTQFKKYGGTIKDNEKVVKVLAKSDRVDIVTEGNDQYSCRSVVLCLGAWTGKFLKSNFNLSLPLQCFMISVCYWKEKKPGAYSPDKFPVGWALTEENLEYVFVPAIEYPGLVKLFYNHGPPIDPYQGARIPMEQSIGKASEFVRSYMPQAEWRQPVKVARCLYTFTPDSHVILDRHPTYRNVVIGAGFSGHGFKFAPVVGKVLGSLAMGKVDEDGKVAGYDLSQVSIDRFNRMDAASSGIRHMM